MKRQRYARVVTFPGRSSRGVVVAMALAQTTVLFSDRGETTSFASLVDGVANPVDPGVTTDLETNGRISHRPGGRQKLEDTNRFVVRIDEDDLVVLVYTVLVDPIRVQDSQVPASPSNTLFSNGTKSTLELEMVDTVTDGLAIGGT